MPRSGYIAGPLPYKVHVDKARSEHLLWLNERGSGFNYELGPTGLAEDFSCDFFFEDQAEAALFRMLFA